VRSYGFDARFKDDAPLIWRGQEERYQVMGQDVMTEDIGHEDLTKERLVPRRPAISTAGPF